MLAIAGHVYSLQQTMCVTTCLATFSAMCVHQQLSPVVLADFAAALYSLCTKSSASLLTDTMSGLSKHIPCSAGKETPNNLRIKVNLSIGSTSFVLLGSDNTTELIRAGLDNLKSIVNMYPETLELLAAVQAVGASSPEGTLLTTGSAHRQRALLHSGGSKALEGDACLALLHSVQIRLSSPAFNSVLSGLAVHNQCFSQLYVSFLVYSLLVVNLVFVAGTSTHALSMMVRAHYATYTSFRHRSFLAVKSACMTGTDMETMDAGSQALAVRYIQKPQDGHADTVAKLSLSPSYVTYNPVTTENVQAFFKTGEV